VSLRLLDNSWTGQLATRMICGLVYSQRNSTQGVVETLIQIISVSVTLKNYYYYYYY